MSPKSLFTKSKLKIVLKKVLIRRVVTSGIVKQNFTKKESKRHYLIYGAPN